MQQVSTTWGVKPWWTAVRWWWRQGHWGKAVVIALTAAIPAAAFSIRHRSLEAEERVKLTNGEQR